MERAALRDLLNRIVRELNRLRPALTLPDTDARFFTVSPIEVEKTAIQILYCAGDGPERLEIAVVLHSGSAAENRARLDAYESRLRPELDSGIMNRRPTDDRVRNNYYLFHADPIPEPLRASFIEEVAHRALWLLDRMRPAP